MPAKLARLKILNSRNTNLLAMCKKMALLLIPLISIIIIGCSGRKNIANEVIIWDYKNNSTVTQGSSGRSLLVVHNVRAWIDNNYLRTSLRNNSDWIRSRLFEVSPGKYNISLLIYNESSFVDENEPEYIHLTKYGNTKKGRKVDTSGAVTKEYEFIPGHVYLLYNVDYTTYWNNKVYDLKNDYELNVGYFKGRQGIRSDIEKWYNNDQSIRKIKIY